MRRIGSAKARRGGGETYSDSGVLFLRSQNIHFDGLRLDDVVYIDESIDREMSSSRVQYGDVLLNITGASLGRCCTVPPSIPNANVNQHVCILRPQQSRIVPGFLNACVASPVVQGQIFSAENGVSREGLNYAQTANIAIAIPSSLREQRAIVTFLGRETARIDALIEKKERLVALLEEKRRAIITHAVSNGLLPEVQKKNTDAAEYPSVPRHWTVTRLKYLCKTN